MSILLHKHISDIFRNLRSEDVKFLNFKENMVSNIY